MARPYNLRGAQILRRGKEGEKGGGGEWGERFDILRTFFITKGDTSFFVNFAPFTRDRILAN